MKKFLAIVLALVLVLGLVACGEKETPENKTEDTYEIAMITDVGEIDDKSFNQGTWEGIKAYAEENKITHKYYKPTEESVDAYLAAIQLAVEGGAKIVVTPGYLFETPIYKAQELYKDVHFILIDGNPNDGDYSTDAGPTYRTDDNTVGIVFAEEQAGYLAGYAAVMDGYTKLGFMGGMAVPAVIRFGYGFAQGADAAAKELGLDNVDLKYHYTGGFIATPEAQTLASSWYADGTEVIFACGGKVGDSVMKAAEASKGKVIGVDVDQSKDSDTVITSAMKGLAPAVQSALADYYADKFPGGQSLTLGAAQDGVKLPMETSKFETFTKDDYDAVYDQLVKGTITLKKDDVKSVDQLGLSKVKVRVIK
ncbi:MAG: BMP family ABC transporter substrate-binding protein [Clostridiales bacterium]|jgi:basic membrane protein A|uniref:BMP family lipoprotein n=1 Tax=Aminipila sp. TaxID=2060095 RepID=UPI001D617BB3|nr:BMP family ABC transporter substrate-binding protein [Aminipila sp.]MBE6034192.1 BMP family ABC transporter substrate-binding protein [Clostridiales bacterium]